MMRPSDLPDFQNPPLNEVVIGVQFNAVRGYQQIFAKDVWELFRSEFPRVQELPALAPTFETFGLPQRQQINFGFMTGAQHDRFWFLTKNEEELIQFQNDRLLHNWRKVGDRTNDYPRFERMIERFSSEISRLSEYMHSRWAETPQINQCEISYVNHLPRDGDSGDENEHWLRFLTFGSRVPEDYNVAFREVIYSKDGKPSARLICDVNSAIDDKGRKIVILTLTVRGAPKHPTVESALEFLKNGREIVVRAFADLTTESAHKAWERIS